MKRLILLMTLAVAVGGCAQLAKKTPTPAAELSTEELTQEPVPPGERYYTLIFGAKSTPMIPRKTHTWATVFRVVEQPDSQPPLVEQHTISWMPVTMDIRPWRFRVEQGNNLDLHTTLQFMLSENEQISAWGPYEIRPALYRRVLIQKAFMESGTVGYQCVDTIGEAARCGNGCDCIHAITDSDPEYDRGSYWLFRYGPRASRFIVDQIAIRGGLIDPSQTHNWLYCHLKLDKYPIERPCWHGPRLSARMTAAWRQLGQKAE